jgi:hypothetical protein
VEGVAQMGWERRGNGQYYYRKRRVGARVVSEYVGAGAIGALTAALAGQRARQRALARQDREQHGAIDAELDRAGAVIRALAESALTKAGYHQHKRGEWRRKRT